MIKDLDDFEQIKRDCYKEVNTLHNCSTCEVRTSVVYDEENKILLCDYCLQRLIDEEE